MQPSNPPVVRLVRELPASPEEVFDAWTDPESLSQWLHPAPAAECTAELDVRVGGQFKIVIRDEGVDYPHWGEYREIDRPNRLVFTWEFDATGDQPSLVTILLRPIGPDRTELTLIHELLPDEEIAARYRGGWEPALAKLEQFVKRGGGAV